MKLPERLGGLIGLVVVLTTVECQSNSTETCVSPYKRIWFEGQTRIMSLKDVMGMNDQYYCDQAVNWNVHANNSLIVARHTEGSMIVTSVRPLQTVLPAGPTAGGQDRHQNRGCRQEAWHQQRLPRYDLQDGMCIQASLLLRRD